MNEPCNGSGRLNEPDRDLLGLQAVCPGCPNCNPDLAKHAEAFNTLTPTEVETLLALGFRKDAA